jgi:hypothetical protein
MINYVRAICVQSKNPDRGQSGTMMIGSDHFQPPSTIKKRQVSLGQGQQAASLAPTPKNEVVKA